VQCLCCTAAVENKSTEAECDFNSQAETAAVRSNSEKLSTGFVSSSALMTSWNRNNSSSSYADSTSSRANSASGKPISDERNPGSHLPGVCDHSVCDKTENFAFKRSSDSYSDAAGTKEIQIHPLNVANKMDYGSVVKQTGDGFCDNTSEAFDDDLSRTIQIVNVDEDLVDMVELFVEREKRGGGEVKKFDYDSERRILTVVFVDEKGLRITSMFLMIDFF